MPKPPATPLDLCGKQDHRQDEPQGGPDLAMVAEPVAVEGQRADHGLEKVVAQGHATDRSEGAFVLSAPLKTADGVALGSLYLKREAPERQWYRADEGPEVVANVGGAVAVLAFIFLWILLPTWVYVDGTERGVRRAWLFAFLTVISSLIGLVVYLISRPEDGKTLTCPGCGREVNGGAFCPHCGRDLSASFCATIPSNFAVACWCFSASARLASSLARCLSARRLTRCA